MTGDRVLASLQAYAQESSYVIDQTAEDRALWAQIADELGVYRAHPVEQQISVYDLFGDPEENQ